MSLLHKLIGIKLKLGILKECRTQIIKYMRKSHKNRNKEKNISSNNNNICNSMNNKVSLKKSRNTIIKINNTICLMIKTIKTQIISINNKTNIKTIIIITTITMIKI